MLEISGLNAGYGKYEVLYDIDITAGSKEITAILGPNGSGKSTILKAIMGLATIYSGSVKLHGMDITDLPAHEKARKGIHYIPQVGNVFTNLTVKENTIMAGYTLKDASKLNEQLSMIFEFFPILKDYFDKKVNKLSGGERQMVAMAMGLIRSPMIMMLDEPTGNLAPKIALEVFNKIIELRDEFEITIVLVEQRTKKALEISDKAYLLVSGRLIFRGEATDLLTHPKLYEMYLGVKTT